MVIITETGLLQRIPGVRPLGPRIQQAPAAAGRDGSCHERVQQEARQRKDRGGPGTVPREGARSEEGEGQ